MGKLWKKEIFKEGGKRMKFDLARKYLVGFLTLAMVMSLFVMPISAAPSPIVNAEYQTSMEAKNPATNTPTWKTGSTATIYIYLKNNGVLVDPPVTCTMYIYPANAGTPVITATKVALGTWTATWMSGTATIIPFIAFLDSNDDVQPDPQYQPSSPYNVEWAEPKPATLTVGPKMATNNVSNGQTTHTITISCKDQFGDPYTGVVTINITGRTETPTDLEDTTGTATYTYSAPSVTTAESSGVLKTETITVVADSVTATAVKVWTYTPTLGQASIEQKEYYNLVGQTHTVTVTFKDQYGQPISVSYDLILKANGTPVKLYPAYTSTHATGTGTRALLTYKGEFGIDELTVTGTVAGTPTTLTGQTKYWAYPWDVSPDDAVNIMGAWHDIYIYGAPGDRYNVTWSTQFGSNQQPILAPDSDPWEGTIPETGVATITVKAEWPGKYFFDVTISMTTPSPSSQGNGWPSPTLFATARGWTGTGPYPTYTEKVAKSWAQLTKLDITPPTDVNPITQTASDVHTVTVAVLGEYPVKFSTTVPPVDPPLGGKYVVIGGVLWVVDAPLEGVEVNWKVQWTDQVVNRVFVEGYDDPAGALPANYAPGTAPFWFTAFSTSDENGEASLTYKLDWNGVGTPTVGSCTYFFPCLTDKITATAEYPEEALTNEFGSITETATKEWRDYAFKLIKYNGHLPIGPNDYIPGAKFFLKRSPTYGALTTAATYFVPAGNSHIYNNPPNNHLVTTDTYGEALWFHLPFGRYYLFEASVPEPYYLPSAPYYTGYYFDITPTAPYWCGPEPKITVHYEVNTPTNPYFYKITYCGTKMVGVTFEVTNDLGETHSYQTDSNGRLSINLADFHPPFDSTYGTEFRVHEVSNAVLESYGVYAVPDFYFFIDKTGKWDGIFYDENGDEVWPVTSLAWAWTTAPNHWVVDPKIGTPPPPPPPTATVNFSLVQGWNMVTPGVESTKTAAQIFGANFVHAYHWDPTLPGPDGSLGGWLFCDDQALVPGLGYWVRMSAASTVALNGNVVSSPATLALSKGWNQIGNPFNTDLSVANVKIVQGATEKSLADAFTAGWIGYAYSWNGTSYDSLNFSTGTMPAGKGFWLRVLVDGLTIKFTK